jgi:hypothetical protein
VNAEQVDQPLWRVGYREDPLGFVPPELCAWNHRFDDLHRRFRTVYLAGLAETALREVLADFRPNLSAIAEFETAMGSEAASELPSASITATWREQHVLARANVTLEGVDMRPDRALALAKRRTGSRVASAKVAMRY